MGLNVKLKTVKPLEESTEENLYDTGLGKALFRSDTKSTNHRKYIDN